MYYIKKKKKRAYQFQAVDESVVCDLLWILFVLSHCFLLCKMTLKEYKILIAFAWNVDA